MTSHSLHGSASCLPLTSLSLISPRCLLPWNFTLLTTQSQSRQPIRMSQYSCVPDLFSIMGQLISTIVSCINFPRFWKFSWNFKYIADIGLETSPSPMEQDFGLRQRCLLFSTALTSPHHVFLLTGSMPWIHPTRRENSFNWGVPQCP